jgi:HlyD family secretion protein
MDRKLQRKRWPAGRIAWFVVSMVVVGVGAYALLFQTHESSLRVSGERIIVSTVSQGPFQEFIPVTGTVIPINKLFLDAVEGGRVEEIYAEAGAMVDTGDRLLKLTNTNLLLDIMWREAEMFQQSNNLRNTRLLMEQYRLQLRTEIADIENDLQQQKRTYERYSELAKDNLIPAHDLELARDEYEYLLERRELALESQRIDLEFRQAQVDALEVSLKRMEDNLAIVKEKQENLTIRAPVSGHLTALNAEIGQSKTPGERLGQIDVLDGFKIRALVDEYYLARVEMGRRGEFDDSDEPVEVQVQKIYPEVRDGRFEVELEFAADYPEGMTRGQTLHLRLELGEISEAILLPRGGFYQATGGAWAYVVDASGSFARKKAIKIGRQNPEVFEVLGGLQPGERVITSSYEGFGNMDRLNLD